MPGLPPCRREPGKVNSNHLLGRKTGGFEGMAAWQRLVPPGDPNKWAVKRRRGEEISPGRICPPVDLNKIILSYRVFIDRGTRVVS